MDRNISVVKDVFITCVLASHKAKQCCWKAAWVVQTERQIISVPVWWQNHGEIKVCDRGRPLKHSHSCLEEGYYGVQPPVCNFKT